MHALCRDDNTLKVKHSAHEVFHWLKRAGMVIHVVLSETRAIGIVHLLIRDQAMIIFWLSSLIGIQFSIAPPPPPFYTL